MNTLPRSSTAPCRRSSSRTVSSRMRSATVRDDPGRKDASTSKASAPKRRSMLEGWIWPASSGLAAWICQPTRPSSLCAGNMPVVRPSLSSSPGGFLWGSASVGQLNSPGWRSGNSLMARSRSPQLFIDDQKSSLLLEMRSLSVMNSTASMVPMGLRIRRNTHIRLKVARSTKSSSLRVPDLLMSMAG